MIVPDVNLLVYAYTQQDARHEAALDWWEGVLNGKELVGLPWMVTFGFLRLRTNPRICAHPAPMEAALRVVEGWHERSLTISLEPGIRHLEIFRGLLLTSEGGSNLVNDAHLAALAIEHRATLFTHDRDFERFSGLKLAYPLRRR